MHHENRNQVIGTNEIPLSYSLLHADTTLDQLVILLPGYGYTNDSPMFRYTTSLCLERSLDILEVNYNYRDERYESVDLAGAIKHDVQLVIDQVLKMNTYESYILIGKSLGTIAMANERTREEFCDAKLIWLTPLLTSDEVYESMLRHQGEQLFMMGTADQYYVEDRIESLNDHPSIDLFTIDDMNHSLEFTGNTFQSLRLLEPLLRHIEKFILK